MQKLQHKHGETKEERCWWCRAQETRKGHHLLFFLSFGFSDSRYQTHQLFTLLFLEVDPFAPTSLQHHALHERWKVMTEQRATCILSFCHLI